MEVVGGWYIGRGAPQKADVPGIDEARGAPPPRSPYLGRSTPNAADTARRETRAKQNEAGRSGTELNGAEMRRRDAAAG